MVPGSKFSPGLVQEGSVNPGDKLSAANGESALDVTAEKVTLWRWIPRVVPKDSG